MSVDIVHKDIYIQIKAIFEGCDTIVDALPFGNAYIETYPQMKSMIMSYMNGKYYKDVIDIKTKQSMMQDVDAINNREEALTAVSKLTEKTTDDVYKRVMERIANKKTYYKREKKKDMIKYISKKCPHCSHVLNLPETSQYVICGYHNANLGYDWNGCGRDWCFQCNKMLCKRWETNSLCLQMNRYHDDECCAKHAKENGYKFPEEYCQCNSMNILNSLIKS